MSQKQRQPTQVERFFIALGTFGVFAGLVVLIAFSVFGLADPVSANPVDDVSRNTLFTSSADGKTVYTWRVSKAVEVPKYVGKVTVDE